MMKPWVLSLCLIKRVFKRVYEKNQGGRKEDDGSGLPLGRGGIGVWGRYMGVVSSPGRVRIKGSSCWRENLLGGNNHAEKGWDTIRGITNHPETVVAAVVLLDTSLWQKPVWELAHGPG